MLRDEGSGRDVPAPLPVSSFTSRVSSNDLLAQQMWLTIASWMAANSYTTARALVVADEIERRIDVMDCTYGQAIASVWDDIKAGRWRPRDH